MTNGDAAMHSLIDECDSAIEDIKREGCQASCPAHPSLARGMIVVLRYVRAKVEIESRNSGDTSLSRSVRARGDLVLGSWRIPPVALWLITLLSVALISSGRLVEFAKEIGAWFH